jgi:Family of unknown function (DUF6152)
MRWKMTLIGGAVLAAAMLFVLPARAHHAHGNYEVEMVDFEGTITELHALNPHSWIYVSRKDAAGKEQLWALEGGGAGGLRRLDSEGKGLKVGDKVKVRCHALRDGSPGCLLGYMKHPDGITYDHDSGTQPVTLENF